FATRPVKFAAFEMGLLFGVISPVTFAFEELREGSRDLNLLLPVRPSGFEQQHADFRIFCQSGSQHTACRSGSDNYVIEHSPSTLYLRTIQPDRQPGGNFRFNLSCGPGVYEAIFLVTPTIAYPAS